MSGTYTRTDRQSFGEWKWHQNDEEKPKYKLGAAQCNGEHYWGFHECTYTSNGGSSFVKARAWNFKFSEVCAEETSGWKGTRDDVTITVTCANGQTTKAPTTQAPTTQKPTTQGPNPTTQGPTPPPTPPPTTQKPKPQTTTQPWGADACVNPSKLNMKLVKGTEATDGFNSGSKASLMCLKDYQFNVPAKTKMSGTCMCLFDDELDDFKCNWQFNKGNVQCVACPKEILMGKNGIGVLGVAEWETGVALYFRIKPWAQSFEGWHVGLKERFSPIFMKLKV